MLTVVYCTRESKPEFKEHLIKTSGLHKRLEVIEIVNNGEALTKAYNRGLQQATNDIVVFCHDDITFESKQWGNKLLKLMSTNQEYGIIGVAGTKYLSQSGRWWENPKKMYGKVQHTHEGKTWLSSYSADLGKDIEETVLVDGLFFAVDKTKLKKTFNEGVEGFHFYDVTFCFENFLEGVKIGVTTIVRVNHQSIGMTNEQWELNRQQFAERFKDKLPVNIKRVLRKNEKLKILIGCLSFTNLTGSELYVYELAKHLVLMGCDVSIVSTIGQPLEGLAKPLGIKLYSLKEPPGFKMGDGKWKLRTSNGAEELSQPNNLYKISETNFDIIHLNHKPVTDHLIRLYPNTPIISTIHSEIIDLEEPVINPMIKRYIAIRPEIKEHIVTKYGIDPSNVSVIYNPVDNKKFNPKNDNKKHKRILFVGTIDYLRIRAIIDIVDQAKNIEHEVYLVGKNNGIDMNGLLANNPHVKYFPQTTNVEKFIHECDITAGILLGRTTIESWMCGKPAWIYDVDKEGQIKNKTFHRVPDDIEKYWSSNVVKEVMDEYIKILE